jgi:hypothetical protein
MTQMPDPPPAPGHSVFLAAEPQRTPFYRDPLILLLFTATFALYLLSMSKTVTLEDDSIFILAGFFNGVSHPPGYPLYTLILHFFTQLPLGDIAARAHASSAFFAALSCCSLFCIFRLIGLERYASVLAVIVFSVTATFWSQAIITEVYSLNVFLNLCLLLYALRIFQDFDGGSRSTAVPPRDFFLFSIVMGLALSNHWPLTVLAAPAYLALIARPFFRLDHKVLVVLPAVVITTCAYLFLYLNNQSSPFINFSGKFTGFAELIDYVKRAHYTSVDFQTTASWLDKAQFGRDLLLQTTRELNLLLIFSAAGFYRLIKSAATRAIGLAIVWAIFANSLLLVLLVDFDYSLLYSLVFRVYPIVSIAMLYVLAGFGMLSLAGGADAVLKKNHVVAILLAGLALNIFLSLPQNYRHQYGWGEEYAQRILAEIPAGATLFSDGEVELGLLGYAHFIKGQRPDIKLYSASALLLDNRLFDYRLENKKAFIENLVAENPQQQFYIANNYYQVSTVSGTPFSARLGKPETESKQSVTSTDIDLLLKWSADDDYTRDPWTQIAIANLRQQAIAIITPLTKSPTDNSLREFAASSLMKLVQSDSDVLVYLKSSIKDEREINPKTFRTQLEGINRKNLLSKQGDSHYVYLVARSSQAQQTEEHLNNSRQQACRNWPSQKNIYCREKTDG